jgi:hypothetical protein
MPPPTRLPDDELDRRYLILDSLERLAKEIAALRERLDDQREEIGARFDALRRHDLEGMKIDIAMLKVKASMWGAVGGAIAGAILSTLIGKLIH